jgi:hypothetical protein
VLGLGLLRLRLRLPGAVGQGWGEGYLSLFMTGSGSKRVNFTNPAQPRRVKIDTVGSRSLRKLINYLARKRKFLLILGGLSELNSK